MKPEKQDLHKLPMHSYWIHTEEGQIASHPALVEDIKTEIAVIGGGIAGITCAFLLGREGQEVVLLEADRIGKGTTGHTTAKVTSQHGLIYHKIAERLGMELAEQYATANETAIKEIKALTNKLSINCGFTAQSAYVYTENDDFLESLYNEMNTALKLGIRADFAESIPLPFTVKGAVRFDDQAQFHPLPYLQVLADDFCKGGGKIFEQTRAVEIDYDSGYVITSSHGSKIKAKTVIIATHYPFYNKHGMFYTRIYQERSYVMAIRAAEPYPGGMYLSAEEPIRSLRSCNSKDGEIILVGGARHKTGQSEDTWQHYEQLYDFVSPYFTVKEIPYRWSAQDCMTIDGLPYAGFYQEDTPGLYLATGFGKWGMTNSMASAMLLRDLIIKGESPWKDVYSPARHVSPSAMVSFAAENFNVAKNLIGGKLESLEKDKEFSLAPGEGQAVEINGERAGAFRGDDGLLYVINTTCTHMGCETNWNTAECTWDCPCHGSRFSPQGIIVEGPAVKEPVLGEDVNPVGKLLTEDF